MEPLFRPIVKHSLSVLFLLASMQTVAANDLLHAGEGKILRTKHILTDTQTLDGRAEAACIRGLQE